MKIRHSQLAATILMCCFLYACVEQEAPTTSDTNSASEESGNITAGFGTTLQISAAAVSTNEANTNLAVDIRLEPRTGAIVTVDYMTTGGSARVGEDFAYAKGQFTFAPGRQSHIINIPLIDDDLAEEDETFILKLHVSENAIPENTTVELTITDNDVAPLIWDEGDWDEKRWQ